MGDMKKKFRLSASEIKQLVPDDLGGCFITDRVTVDGLKIGYMYQRYAPRFTAYGAPGPAGTVGHFFIVTTDEVPTAFWTDNGPASIHPHWQINRKHVEIRGCWGSDYGHFHRGVALARSVVLARWINSSVVPA